MASWISHGLPRPGGSHRVQRQQGRGVVPYVEIAPAKDPAYIIGVGLHTDDGDMVVIIGPSFQRAQELLALAARLPMSEKDRQVAALGVWLGTHQVEKVGLQFLHRGGGAVFQQL